MRRDRPQRRIRAIADGAHNVAHETITPSSLNRRAGEAGAKCGVVKRREFRERRDAQLVAHRHARFTRCLRELVPGTHGQAIIAPEHAAAERFAEFKRDLLFGFDREVGKASARIELVWRWKRFGRAHIETRAA